MMTIGDLAYSIWKMPVEVIFFIFIWLIVMTFIGKGDL